VVSDVCVCVCVGVCACVCVEGKEREWGGEVERKTQCGAWYEVRVGADVSASGGDKQRGGGGGEEEGC
jgi:hypothetical protein